ncbi:MAG: macro domain-containing protein, partial [Nitrospirota bacterium]|nr:macro domain-containing protein [Nitrospirota bacterium]
AALRLADEKGFASIALPGMGTGVGGVAHAEAAAVMLKEIKEFQGKSLRSVILVDVAPAMIEAWNGNL